MRRFLGLIVLAVGWRGVALAQPVASPPAPAPAAAVPATARGPAQVMVALDVSASMKVNDPNGLVRSAVGATLAHLEGAAEAGLVVFDEHARVVQPLRKLADAGVREALAQSVAQVAFDGQWTNIPEGVERALYELKQAPEGGRKILVVVTDGLIDTGNKAGDEEKARWLRESLLPDCKAAGVRVLGVAFTEGADYALLQQMAQATDGSYYRALAQPDVAGIFAQLEKDLTPPPPPPPAPKPVPATSPAQGHGAAPRSFVFLAWGALLVAAAALGVAALLIRARAKEGSPGEPVGEYVLHDLKTGDQRPFETRVVRVGRRPDNDLVISHPTVSGHHARIENREGSVFLVDLRSMNGTFLNDRRVEGEALLRNGDVLRFDKHAFAFEVPGEMDGEATRMGGLGDRTMLAFGSDGGGTDRFLANQTGGLRQPPDDARPGTVAPCPEHPSMFATEKCGECGKRGCYSCIRVVDGQRRCQACS